MQNRKYLLILIGFIFTSPLLVSAHAHILKSLPAKDSILATSPEIVSIQFSEALEISMSKMEVENLDTHQIVSDKSLQFGKDKNTIQIAVKDLGKQKHTYQVTWKATSKDSHSMKGSYQFIVDPKSE